MDSANKAMTASEKAALLDQYAGPVAAWNRRKGVAYE